MRDFKIIYKLFKYLEAVNMKKTLFSMMLILILSFSTIGSAAAAQSSGSFLSDMISLTSGLSSFFGSAMQNMTQAIGYLTGGVQAAHLFQSGTNIVNGMLVNGPQAPPVPLPQVIMPGAKPPADPASTEGAQLPDSVPAAGSATAAAAENPAQGADVSPQFMSNEEFSGLLKGYNSLSIEEKNLVNQMKAAPEDASIKELYNHVQAAKLEKSTKIIASLNYDIEKQQFSKLNLLIDYVNTTGPQTVKVFAQIVDSARGKLQFCLIEAKKYGLNMDIEIIEGKLKLVMSLTTGSFIPSAPPASAPMGEKPPAASVSAPKPPAADSEAVNSSRPTDFNAEPVMSINENISGEAKPETKTPAKAKKTTKKKAAVKPAAVNEVK